MSSAYKRRREDDEDVPEPSMRVNSSSSNPHKLPGGLVATPVECGEEKGTVMLVQDPYNDHFTYNIGNSLWSASLEVIQYWKDVPPLENKKKSDRFAALEVGAGCGLLGLAMWRHGYDTVTLTDLDEMLPIMNYNIEWNNAGDYVQAMALDWSDGGLSARSVYEARGPFDLIVGAEVSYDESLHEGLLDSIVILCGGGCTAKPSKSLKTPARVLLAIPLRDSDPQIIAIAEVRGFVVTELKSCPACPNHDSEQIIYELRAPARWPEVGPV